MTDVRSSHMTRLFFLAAMVFIACAQDSPKYAIRIYDHRAEIASTFTGMSVHRTGIGNRVFLFTYNNGRKNEYVFSVHNNAYFLTRRTLSFDPDSVLGIGKKQLEAVYQKELKRKLRDYLKKMDSLGIKDISSDFNKHGIDLKIYMKPRGVMLYVSDSTKVVNKAWIDYLASMEKLDGNWYYSRVSK